MDGATRFARHCSLCFVSAYHVEHMPVWGATRLDGTCHCVLVVRDIYWSDIRDV